MAELREAQQLLKGALDRALNRALRGEGSETIQAAIVKAERVEVAQDAGGAYCAIYACELYDTGETETAQRLNNAGEIEDFERPVMGWRRVGEPIICLAHVLRRSQQIEQKRILALAEPTADEVALEAQLHEALGPLSQRDE